MDDPNRARKPRRPKGVTTAPMELFACDTVERIQNGIRRYVFTFIDPRSRFAWASRPTQEQPPRRLCAAAAEQESFLAYHEQFVHRRRPFQPKTG